MKRVKKRGNTLGPPLVKPSFCLVVTLAMYWNVSCFFIGQMVEQTRQAAARGDATTTPLSELELVSYISEDGMVSKVDTKGVKASVYAIYDEVSRAWSYHWLGVHAM